MFYADVFFKDSCRVSGAKVIRLQGKNATIEKDDRVFLAKYDRQCKMFVTHGQADHHDIQRAG